MLNNLKVVFTVSKHRRALLYCFLAWQDTAEQFNEWTLYLSVGNIVVLFFSLAFPEMPFCLPALCLCPLGLREQRPDQREDLSDLSDSKSGQDGLERSKQQEVYSGSPAAFWGGRYFNWRQMNWFLTNGWAKNDIPRDPECSILVDYKNLPQHFWNVYIYFQYLHVLPACIILLNNKFMRKLLAFRQPSVN